jgi:hypothetical protein
VKDTLGEARATPTGSCTPGAAPGTAGETAFPAATPMASPAATSAAIPAAALAAIQAACPAAIQAAGAAVYLAVGIVVRIAAPGAVGGISPGMTPDSGQDPEVYSVARTPERTSRAEATMGQRRWSCAPARSCSLTSSLTIDIRARLTSSARRLDSRFRSGFEQE